ncbi:MAG TPA: glycosyltransferase [Acidimicrobiia bacterium]|nr:glycosyltransferase [Acidimicrobiia bacterium]
MITVVYIVSAVILVYFLAMNVVYATTSVLAFIDLKKYVGRLKSLHIGDLVNAAGGMPITLIVPAFNEEAGIVESVRSLLTLQYSDYEIIVVDDGSTDGTLGSLVEAFQLIPADRAPSADLLTAPVRSVHRAARHPNLWVVSKDNGGKADSLNAGLNHSRTPLFCAMDADTLLEPEALPRLVRPFLENRNTVAAGGIVRIANGCVIDGGIVRQVLLPKSIVAQFQVVEYLRAFLAARVGWDVLQATLIISGAFGVFKRGIVVDAGGFATGTVGEDMELVVRLHRHCRENDIAYRIAFIPDPVAWTEAPEDLRSLGRQRNRWQRGLVQTLWRHRQMFGNPLYGPPALIGFTYYGLFEVIGPFIEAVGFVVFFWALIAGIAPPSYILAFLALAVAAGVALSVAAVALEELSFRRYSRPRDLGRLMLMAFIENLGYRQLATWWRIRGLFSALRGDQNWGTLERRGFKTQEP